MLPCASPLLPKRRLGNDEDSLPCVKDQGLQSYIPISRVLITSFVEDYHRLYDDLEHLRIGVLFVHYSHDDALSRAIEQTYALKMGARPMKVSVIIESEIWALAD